jgi:hypothetical protein
MSFCDGTGRRRPSIQRIVQLIIVRLLVRVKEDQAGDMRDSEGTAGRIGVGLSAHSDWASTRNLAGFSNILA